MPERKRRYPLEEFARRGRDIYSRVVRPVVEPGDRGKYVAIDIDSEGYEIDPDEREAASRLLHRYPEAQIWMERVGHAGADRLGGRSLVEDRE